jgi:hypothetical protein
MVKGYNLTTITPIVNEKIPRRMNRSARMGFFLTALIMANSIKRREKIKS